MTVFKTPRADRDFEAYKLILDLWVRENPIKHNNMNAFLAVNSLLLMAVTLGRGFTPASWPLYAGGALLAAVWMPLLGRVTLSQKIWGLKLQEYVSLHPNDERFTLHDGTFQRLQASSLVRFCGGLPSSVYLLGIPLLIGLFWLALLAYFSLWSQ